MYYKNLFLNLLLSVSVLTFSGTYGMSKSLQISPMSWGYSSRCGDRLRNEDKYCVVERFNGDSNQCVFCIFDGHNGDQAAKYATENIARILNEYSERYSDIGLILIATFKQIDQEICQNYDQSGATALVGWIIGAEFWVAWVGDSRGLIIRDNGIIKHTTDHKPSNESEKKRIYQHGEKIYHNGCWRVLGLAVSRVLGDQDIRGCDSKVIISEPEVFKVDLQEDDVIVFATDGAWDTLGNGEVCEFLHGFSQSSIEFINDDAKLRTGQNDSTIEKGNNILKGLATKLRDEAYQQGSSDNISVLMVKFSGKPIENNNNNAN